MKKLRAYTLLILLLMLTAISGCGIYSFTGASYGSAKTVTIDFFQNRASYVNPSLSSTITEKLKDKFMNQTPLTLVQKGGDMHFEGFITGYSITSEGIKSNEKAANNKLTITVKVTFTNETAPENDFSKSFSRDETFPVSQSFSSAESSLVEGIVEKLIQDIFNEAVVNW